MPLKIKLLKYRPHFLILLTVVIPVNCLLMRFQPVDARPDFCEHRDLIG